MTTLNTAAPTPPPAVVPTMPVVPVAPSGVSTTQAASLVMQNSFTGANMQFSNLHIHLMLAEVVSFRKQLTVRNELKSQSGWSDALNAFMTASLNGIVSTLNNITYKTPSVVLTGGVATDVAVAGTTVPTTSGTPSANTISPSSVVMPASYQHNVVWDLSGNNADLPQVTPLTIPNDFGRAFITLLDRLFVELTRLDSRHQPFIITQYESAMMMGMINQMFNLLQTKGGSANQVATPTGTLPTMEDGTFQGAAGVAVSQTS